MKRILNLMCAIMALCWITSCSESAKDFYQYINDDCYAVASVDALAIMENAGFEVGKNGIEMPQYIKSTIPSYDREQVDKLLSLKGIDPRRIMVVVKETSGQSGVFGLVKVTDNGDLAKSLSDMDFDKASSGGYDIFTQKDFNIVVDGNMAVMIMGDSNDMPEIINDLKNDAEKKALASWQKDMLGKGNTIALVINFDKFGITEEIMREAGLDNADMFGLKDFGYLSYAVDLKGPEMKMNIKMLDKNGSTLDSPMSKGKVDKSMLKYANQTDFVAALLATTSDGSWKEMIYKMLEKEMRSDARMIRPVIELMNGKIMASFGYDNIQMLVQRGACHYSVAVQAEKGKGAELFDVIKGLINAAGAPYKDNGDMIDIELGYGAPSVYIERDGDNIVLTSTPTRGKGSDNKFNSGDFGSGCASIVAQVAPRSSNITFISLPFGIDLKSNANDEGSTITLKLTDTEGGLLENIFKTAASYR